MAETGRRRCGITEHRKQIRLLQKRIECLHERNSRLFVEARAQDRRIAELTNEIAAVRTWRALRLCRWFGHREWYVSAKFPQRSGYCGRCGTRL